jgi:hypothetical protein
MKNALIVFTALFMTGYLFTSVNAKQSPTIDEIDALLSKVSKNIQSAGEVTKMAQTMNAKMVESKVAEKEALKESVVMAEKKVEQMEKVQEVFVAKMIDAGVDTTLDEAKMKGPAYDEFIKYQKNGGVEDFEYFRLYIYK